MRVLYIPSGDDKYGAPKSMMELVGNLKERYGIEPIILTCTEGLINKWCSENNIECYVLGQAPFMVVGGSNWFRKIVKHGMYPYLKLKYHIQSKKARVKIEELLKEKNIDIVHTNVNRVDIGGYYALRHKLPHIMHLREFGKEDYNCMYLRTDAIEFLNNSTTRFIAISNIVKRAWKQKGLDKSKISVIYNGIDFSKFPTNIPERIDSKKDKIRIVFVGIISETKGQMQLIKAIERMPIEVRKNVIVDFYGGGRTGYINKLKRYVYDKKLDDYIMFKGYCNNVSAMLTTYDIGVVSSRAEAFGRVTAEYMAAGLCVIASNTGANTEIIQNEKNGLIYQYNDVDELKACIEKLINNPDKLREMRQVAFACAREKYTMNRCADEIYKVYKEMMEK